MIDDLYYDRVRAFALCIISVTIGVTSSVGGIIVKVCIESRIVKSCSASQKKPIVLKTPKIMEKAMYREKSIKIIMMKIIVPKKIIHK